MLSPISRALVNLIRFFYQSYIDASFGFCLRGRKSLIGLAKDAFNQIFEKKKQK